MKMEEFDKSSLYYVDSTPEGTRYSLYDTAIWKNGLAFKNIDFSETGLPVIKIAELNNGISSSTAYTDKTYSQDVFLTKGDYVFSWSGNPETSIDIYKYNLPDGWLNQHIFKVTPKTEIIDKGFFFYLMKFLKPYFKKIATNKQTTGLGHVTISDLQRMSVTLPPLPTQQKIAAILSSLDNKIELNNKINTNLEQQAQTLFKNWFVDFEPFGGKMPEGWKVGKLSDVSILSAGGDKPKEVSDKLTENYKVPIYSNGLDNFGLYGYTNNAKIFEEAVTVSARGTIGFVCLRMEPYVPIVRLISLIPKTDFVSAKYLYLHLLNCNIAGTGTTQQQLTVPAFSKEQIIIPPKNVIDSFTNTVNPFFEIIVHNRKENEILSSMRDTLLPKLMNGEIKVDEVCK